MSGLVQWLMLALAAAIGLMGLILASRASDFGMTLAGTLFFLFGFLFVIARAGHLAEQAAKGEE